MGARILLGLCALLSACMIHAATLPIWPDIDYVSFVSNRPDQVKGGTIRFTGMFTVNNFGQNDITYCGFTNQYRNFNYSGLGLPGIQTSTGAAGIRFKQQNLLFKAKWYLKEVRQMGRVVWEFTPRGYAMTQGRTYTVRAVFKVDPHTQQDEYEWRFFCESKYTDPDNITANYYPFKEFKTIPLLPATTKKRGK